MVQKTIETAAGATEQTAGPPPPVLYFRLAFNDKSAAGKTNIITSLRGVGELTPGCKSGRTMVRFPFVKDTLLRPGLSVADVSLLGDPTGSGGVVWRSCALGLALSLSARRSLRVDRDAFPAPLPAG